MTRDDFLLAFGIHDVRGRCRRDGGSTLWRVELPDVVEECGQDGSNEKKERTESGPKLNRGSFSEGSTTSCRVINGILSIPLYIHCG